MAALLQALQAAEAQALALGSSVATHPTCGSGGTGGQAFDALLAYLETAVAEIQAAHALVVEVGPTYAVGGHVTGDARRAVSALALAAYKASLVAVTCTSGAPTQNEPAVALSEDLQGLASQAQDLSLRAQRCYVSAYLGLDPVTRQCQ